MIVPSVRVIGGGRAGTSLHRALVAAGWTSAGVLGRDDDPTAAARGVDLLVLATPDAAIGEVAARVDPVPTTVVAHLSGATGLDVLSHALESYTAIPFTDRPRPDRPIERPAYQGTNPISDIWAIRALEMVRDYLPRAVADTSDDEARGQMLLAAAIAGIGFGNAGVHLPHGMSYPVAGRVKDFHPAGYDVDHALVPHGISVILNPPAVVRFTAPADPAPPA